MLANLKRLASIVSSWFSRGGYPPQNRYRAARRYSTDRSYLDAEIGDARFEMNDCDRRELLRKSIYWEQNNAIVNRMADVFEEYTVGTGLVVTPASSDKDWNASAKREWSEWGKFPDVCSRQSFGVLQGLIARLWFIHGEVFILKTRGESGRPRIQLLESHRVSTPSQLSQVEGETIIDGVQIDANGRPVAYWVEQVTGSWKPVPADQVIHVFEPSRAGQYRGVTFLHAVLDDIHDLDDLQILEQKAAKRNAEIANVVYNESGEAPDSDTLRRMRHRDSTENPDGVEVEREREVYYKSAFGGRTVYMRRGDKVDQYSNDRPGVAQREYWDYLAAKICAGVGMSKQLVFPVSIQGTVVRADLDVAAAFFKSRSSVMCWAVQEIFIWVISRNAKLIAGRPEDWTNVTIRCPRSVNVDVGRNSAAMLKELKAGATTFEQIYGPLGLDWMEQLTQRAREVAFIAQLSAEHGIPEASISDMETKQEPEAQPA